ncbi:hypothetical protein PM082_021828 [Marasmius tenuissimus]|nr:hypothetical protein PM082_021828 [Marasmius tenuissimus]
MENTGHASSMSLPLVHLHGNPRIKGPVNDTSEAHSVLNASWYINTILWDVRGLNWRVPSIRNRLGVTT